MTRLPVPLGQPFSAWKRGPGTYFVLSRLRDTFFLECFRRAPRKPWRRWMRIAIPDSAFTRGIDGVQGGFSE